MRFTLHHKFIASIAAAAVAITAFTAAPAAAGDRNRDLAKIAVGILGVAIVGKIIHDKNPETIWDAFVELVLRPLRSSRRIIHGLGPFVRRGMVH